MIFSGFFNRIKGAFHNVTQAAGLEQPKKSVFDIAGVPAFNEFYNFGIFPWKWIYRGYYKTWHLVPAPTIKDPRGTRQMERMDAAKAVCQEMASIMWSEKCGISVSQKGYDPKSKTLDPLQVWIDSVLTDNNFMVKMQESVEQALALGGAALKVWAEQKFMTDDKGNPITDANGQFVVDPSVPPRLRIGYAMADQFIPLAWDNSEVTEGIFIRRTARGGYYYTLLEWHQWDGTTYVIRNQLYRADQKNESNEPQNILGFQRPLDEMYKFLSPEVRIEDLDHSLFSYFRTNIANNLDDNSPLGVSIYANALSTLKALDVAFDSLVREFVLGKRRIIVPASCVHVVPDPDTGAMLRYFDANDEVYQAFKTDNPADLKITDNTVELRVTEHVAAINALLGILEVQTGLAPGTLTFTGNSTRPVQTATQVMADKQKTYKTCVSHEIPLKSAIERLVDNLIAVAVLYDMDDGAGHKIEDLTKGGYDTNVFFDDSIIQDRQTNITEGVMLMTNQVMSRKTFMVERLGMTPEDADKELAQIAKEGQVTGGTLDQLIQQANEGGDSGGDNTA